MSKQFVFFANTKWFLSTFKTPLINLLASDYSVTCLYLRPGPPVTLDINASVTWHQFSLRDLIFCPGFASCPKSIPIIFTIGPILLSPILFRHVFSRAVIVLEGLGRVFSSTSLHYRLLRRFIKYLYRYLFSRCSNVVCLNYSDISFLSSSHICPADKLRYIPGTGVDSSLLNLYSRSHNPSCIDFIGRPLADKGFYDFIYAASFMSKISPSNDMFFALYCHSKI